MATVGQPGMVGADGLEYSQAFAGAGLSGLLIIVCVAIYAVLIRNIVVESSVSRPYGRAWGIRCRCAHAV